MHASALDFISDILEWMPAISRHFLAQTKKVGGSLMRIYRDTRFSMASGAVHALFVRGAGTRVLVSEGRNEG